MQIHFTIKAVFKKIYKEFIFCNLLYIRML